MTVKDPDEILARVEEMRQVIQIVEEQLLPREVEALLLRYRDNLSISEAAEQMCINRRPFLRYICIGLKKIRQFMKENIIDKTEHT